MSARILIAGGALILAGEATARTEDQSATARIGREGAASLDRLNGAMARQKGTAVTPGPLPPLSKEAQTRAAQGLRQRVRSDAMARRAQTAVAAGQVEIVRERETMARRLGQAMGLERPDVTALARTVSPPVKNSWVPVLFVSSSIPTTILRTYAAQLARAKGVIAFRGLPEGMTKVAPIAKLSAEILRIDPGCEGPACAMQDVQLIVDPIVFRQHNVVRVPALAMIPGDPTLPYCERDDQSPRAGAIAYGDAALSGLLEEIARLGGREEVRDAQARLGAR